MANALKTRIFILATFIACLTFALFLSQSPFASEKSSKKEETNYSRDYISIVGSSTVYPFTASIAERFGHERNYKTPTVESTGTGGGFKLFCGGVGYKYPDFSNASRRIEVSEIKKCNENGVKQIGEIKIGYDGIVIANSLKGKKINLSKQEIFLALSEKVFINNKLVKNPYKKWSDISKSLPNIAIRVYGPPASSGTRDAFVELVMQDACMNMEGFVFAYADKKVRQKNCSVIRSDGAFIEAGENDNLILQKLRNDKDAFGIFGYSFLEENKNNIQAATLDNVEPDFSSIIQGRYKISRPLFIYFKKEHFGLVPNMKEFVQEIIKKSTLSKDGYLVQKGLIPLSDFEIDELKDRILGDL